jgi:hypothetical protein
MAKTLACGGLVVDAAATVISLPGLSDCSHWIVLGLLTVLPIAYGIAGSILLTALRDT